MPTALICGDPHGQFSHIVEAALRRRPAAVFLLGDMDAARPLEQELAAIAEFTRIFWIPGNHDTDSEENYDNVFESALAPNNLHGRVITVDGLRVAGMGGVFRKKIWDGHDAIYESPAAYVRQCGKGNLWRGGLPLRHRSSLFPSDFTALSDTRADMLLSHEAPEMHPHGNTAITELSTRLGVRNAFHGHHHEDIEYPGGVWRGVGFRQLHEFEW